MYPLNSEQSDLLPTQEQLFKFGTLKALELYNVHIYVIISLNACVRAERFCMEQKSKGEKKDFVLCEGLYHMHLSPSQKNIVRKKGKG